VGRVVIGMDPHKASATIGVLDGRERILHAGQYGTDSDGSSDKSLPGLNAEPTPATTPTRTTPRSASRQPRRRTRDRA
jgi:hypothetical protein